MIPPNPAQLPIVLQRFGFGSQSCCNTATITLMIIDIATIIKADVKAFQFQSNNKHKVIKKPVMIAKIEVITLPVVNFL